MFVSFFCVQKLIWPDQKAVAPSEFPLSCVSTVYGGGKKNEVFPPTLFLYMEGHLLSHFSCHKKVYKNKKNFHRPELMTENRNKLKAFHLEK